MKSKRSSVRHQAITVKLLKELWSLNPPGSRSSRALRQYQAMSYFNHYEKVLHGLDGERSNLKKAENQSEKVVALVKLVRGHWEQRSTTAEAHESIKKQATSYLLNPVDESVDEVFKFALQMWLFVSLNVSSSQGTIQDAVRTHVQTVLPAQNGEPAADLRLSEDFSVWSMARKTGLKVEFTNDLTEHLKIDPNAKFTIKVFGCASALEEFDRSGQR